MRELEYIGPITFSEYLPVILFFHITKDMRFLPLLNMLLLFIISKNMGALKYFNMNILDVLAILLHATLFHIISGKNHIYQTRNKCIFF